MTQTEKVLAHILVYGSITPLEAMREYSIMRLASRINDLKRAGFDIRREIITSKNKAGEPVRYAKYYIDGYVKGERKNVCSSNQASQLRQGLPV